MQSAIADLLVIMFRQPTKRALHALVLITFSINDETVLSGVSASIGYVVKPHRAPWK